MSSANNFMVTIDRDHFTASQIIKDVVKNLVEKHTTLTSVVESVGVFMKDEDPAIRSKAVLYLSRIIEHVPSDFFSRQQIQVLVQFLCDRIEDGGALLGLQVLVGLPRFNSDMAIAIFRAVVSSFQDLQSHVQTVRFRILTLLSSVIYKWRVAIQRLADESLVGIVDLLSGEKDPRNLMIAFSILRIVLAEWDISRNVDILFDAVFCYFPVTFTPPPNDPYGITAQDLKQRLRDCLATSSLMAPKLFSNLIEKLDSISVNAKKDVIDVIGACALHFDSITLSHYSIALWDALKYEVFNAHDDMLAEGACETVAGLALGLSKGNNTEHDGLEQYLRSIVRECNSRLDEPQNKQAKAAVNILKILAEASFQALGIVVGTVLKPLLAGMLNSNSVETLGTSLEVLHTLLSTMASQSSILLCRREQNPLSQIKEEAFPFLHDIWSQIVSVGTASSILAARCLTSLCKIPGLLDANEVDVIIREFNSVLIVGKKVKDDALVDCSIACLADLSNVQASHIIALTLPELISKLPSTQPNDESYLRILEYLAKISMSKEVSSVLVRRLYAKLETSFNLDVSLLYSKALLLSLIYVLSKRDLSGDAEVETYLEKTLDIIRKHAKSKLSSDHDDDLGTICLLDLLGKLSGILIRGMDSRKHQEICRHVYHMYYTGNEETPLWKVEPKSKARISILIATHVIAAVNRHNSLTFTSDQFILLFRYIVEFCTHEKNTLIRERGLQHLALVVCKFAQPEAAFWLRSLLLDTHGGFLNSDASSMDRLRIGVWISKALVSKFLDAEEIISRYVESLSHPELGFSIALALPSLLHEDDIFTKKNGAKIRKLASQKIYHCLMLLINQRLQAADHRLRINYLTAISGILRCLQVETIVSENTRIIPIILQCLEQRIETVKLVAIETFMILVVEDPQSLRHHMSSMICQLINIALDQQTNTEVLRHNALKCLRLLPGRLENTRLIPYRRQVCGRVQLMLDDLRREVRKEAVDCKTAWLSLDDIDNVD